MIYSKDINRILRQKFPLIMVDRIIEIEPNKKCIGQKNISIGEPCFQGHFPEEPIFPGTMIIEVMAQVGGFIFMQEGKKQQGYIAAIEQIKFLKKVIPGDVLIISCEAMAKIGNLAKIMAIVTVDDEIVAKGNITYSFDEEKNDMR